MTTKDFTELVNVDFSQLQIDDVVFHSLDSTNFEECRVYHLTSSLVAVKTIKEETAITIYAENVEKQLRKKVFYPLLFDQPV